MNSHPNDNDANGGPRIYAHTVGSVVWGLDEKLIMPFIEELSEDHDGLRERDGRDCTNWIQRRAEELADELYSKDYYKLSDEERQALDNSAVDDYQDYFSTRWEVELIVS